MRPKNEIRFGFLIRNNKVYDTKIQSYSIVKTNVNGLIICRMISNSYKRLNNFEWLLNDHNNDYIFNFLKEDEWIRKQRKNDVSVNEKTLINASNMSIVYRYPPKYLNQKKFYLYKSCQALKKKLS
jgi:uncharacterized protein YbbC (DUF1343 family)